MSIAYPTEMVLVEKLNGKWYGDLTPAFCLHCNQSFFMKSTLLNQYCPFCLEFGFEIHPILTFSEKPELILPFQINLDQVEDFYNQFLENFWFKPKEINPSKLKSRASLHYLTMWLVDSHVDGFWKAEVGFDYKIKSSVDTFNNQTWDSRDEIGIKTRWESRMGEVHRQYQNIKLPALAQHERLIRMIGDFDYMVAVPILDVDLQEMVAAPELNPQKVWDQAKAQIDKAVENECMLASDAQHIRGYSISAEYGLQNWTLLLLPYIATFYVNDSGEKIPVYLNGQSGQIYGSKFASTRKALIVAGLGGVFALVVFIMGIIAMILGSFAPPLPIFGVILITVAFFIGTLAILPIFWAMFHNKYEKENAIRLID